jgi:trans-2,3-dihydro-3-hydroxyanthranilate isomerase
MVARQLDYLLVDVFTRTPLSGNPLAVVLKADGLGDDEMQRIAREFNLSETIFICRSAQERTTAAVRIFTPGLELPFAGHPTVGAAVVLGLEHKLSVVRLEEHVGLVTAVVERHDRKSGEAMFALPKLPEPSGAAPAKVSIALALGLDQAEIGFGRFQPAVYSAGVIFYLVPVRDKAALGRLKPNAGAWRDAFKLGTNAVYCFTPEDNDADFAARMFAPGMGLGEDPATGAAAAALIGLLAEHVDTRDGQIEYVIRQGVEMGRPSRIRVQLRFDGGRLTHGGVGGDAVIIGRGTLDLDL